MTVQVIRAFHQKNSKKADKLSMKFSTTLIQVCQCASIPYFKLNTPFFCWPISYKEYLSSQFKINKMVNIVDYHPSPLGLNSPYFYRLLKASCLSRIFVKFSLKPVYLTMVGENFKFIILRSLENAFASQ